jgi:hypothetical protein
MSSKVVYRFGSVTVPLLAGESIAVFTKGYANVSQVIGYPNHPDTVNLLGVVNNGETVFGPYSAGAQIVIDAGPQGALYESGTAPVVTGARDWQIQNAPVALDATGALTSAAILGGLVTSTTVAAVTGTLPTGTVLDAADTALIATDSFDWSVVNTGATNAFTVAVATGHTIVGSATVALSTSARFRTRKTATATYVTYRLC